MPRFEHPDLNIPMYAAFLLPFASTARSWGSNLRHPPQSHSFVEVPRYRYGEVRLLPRSPLPTIKATQGVSKQRVVQTTIPVKIPIRHPDPFRLLRTEKSLQVNQTPLNFTSFTRISSDPS